MVLSLLFLMIVGYWFPKFSVGDRLNVLGRQIVVLMSWQNLEPPKLLILCPSVLLRPSWLVFFILTYMNCILTGFVRSPC